MAHAIAHCAGAVFRVLEVNGGRTMNANEPFRRRCRDLLAMRNHVSATLEVNAPGIPGAAEAPFKRAQPVMIQSVGERMTWMRHRIWLGCRARR